MCAGEDMLLREREGGYDYVKVANDMESEKVLQVAWSHSGSKEWKNGFPPERTLRFIRSGTQSSLTRSFFTRSSSNFNNLSPNKPKDA